MGTDNKMTIMIVEDDQILAREIKAFLEQWGYTAGNVLRFDAVMDEFNRLHPQMILLDINLPYCDGFYWCRKIRESSQVPIIFISSRADDWDKIMAIMQGGDDYVEKPYNPAELTARIKAHLRRYHVWGEEKPKADEDRIINGGLVLDKKQRIVIVEGEEVRLTATEYKILELLMEHPGQIFPAEQIYEKVWNEQADYAVENTVMVHIRHIREKVEIDSKRPRYVKVVWGIGYKMEKYC